MNITFRKAQREDIPLLVKFRISQLNDEEEHPQAELETILDGWFQRMLDESRLIQYLAVCQDQVIACGALLVMELPPDFFNPTGRIAYLTNMYTLPEYRRRGIASHLLDLLKKEAENKHLDGIYLEASQWGAPLYRKYGFYPAEGWMYLDLHRDTE